MKFKELILIGGGDYRKEENVDIDKYLTTIIMPNMKIMILPFATSKEKYISWASALFTNFKKYGLKNFEILDEELPSNILANRINSAEVLFIIGGLPDVLLDKIRNKKLEKTIRDYTGVIIGYSAGALAACNECIILPEEGYTEVKVLPGLGLCDFSTYVHYKPSHDSYLKELSKQRRIYALSNKSAIICNKKRLSFIGDIFVFNKCSKKQM